MPRYAGSKGAVYASTTLAGAVAFLPSLSKWTLDMATDKIDVTAFQDANKVYVQGQKDIKGTVSGFWDSANDALFDAAESADGVRMVLYPSTLAPGLYFAGPAWLDASLEVDSKGAVTVSGEFVAAGSWSRS
jgi:hypothetical protein